MVDSRATIGFLLTRASATSGWTWIRRSGKLLRPGDPGPRERDMRRAICLKCFACFRIWLDGWILNILKYFLKKRTMTRVFNNKRVLFGVVKSSWLPGKIAAYLVSIGWLLCLAFLYRWCFSNKISLDWALNFDNTAIYFKTFWQPWLLLGSLWGYCNNIHVLLYISHAYHVQFEMRFAELEKGLSKRIFLLDKIRLKLTDSMGKCPSYLSYNQNEKYSNQGTVIPRKEKKLNYRIQGKFSRYIYWGGLVAWFQTDEPMSHWATKV